MKFVSLNRPPARLGIVCDDHCFLIPVGDQWPPDMISLIENFEDLRGSLLQLTCDETSIPLSDIEFAAPISNCEKIICIGKNYAEHAIEMGGEPPSLPVVFSKFASAINHPNAPIVLPALSKKLDYEAELVVVIGKPGKTSLNSRLSNTCLATVAATTSQPGTGKKASQVGSGYWEKHAIPSPLWVRISLLLMKFQIRITCR